MIEPEEASDAPRGPAARLGICLLNLGQPGLGLVRLGHHRIGLILIGTTFASMYAVLAYYALGPLLTYSSYLALLAVMLAIWLGAYGIAFVLSWRRSKRIETREGWLWRWYGVLALAVGLNGVWLLTPDFRSYYGSFYAASESMLPTLRPGDRFLADMRGREPVKRGDIAIVRSHDRDYVMRVAGVPGDSIAMVGGAVVLNGGRVAQRADGLEGGTRIFREQFPGEAAAHAILDRGPALQDDMPAVRLGAGQFFVLGDNRDNALDSRFGEALQGPGIVTRDRIKGRVLFRYWGGGEALGNTPL